MSYIAQPTAASRGPARQSEAAKFTTGSNTVWWLVIAGVGLLLAWPYLVAVEPNLWRRLAALAVLGALGAYGWAMLVCRQQEYDERQRGRQQHDNA